MKSAKTERDDNMPDFLLEELAVIMTVNCVRNTCIENYHAAGKLTDSEMKELNKEVADRIYTFLELLLVRSKQERQDFLAQEGFLASSEVRTWDKPGFVIGMWPGKTDPAKFDPRFTPQQGRYMTFIHQYTIKHGESPVEAEIQQYFRDSRSTVHQTVLTLEKKGLIKRTPGQERSIKVMIPADELPELPVKV